MDLEIVALEDAAEFRLGGGSPGIVAVSRAMPPAIDLGQDLPDLGNDAGVVIAGKLARGRRDVRHAPPVCRKPRGVPVSLASPWNRPLVAGLAGAGANATATRISLLPPGIEPRFKV